MRRLAGALALAVCVTASADTGFTGTFVGTGRVCYGNLDVRTKTLSWLTYLSQCQRVPYTVLEQREHGNERVLTFALATQDKACRYRIVYLRHHDIADPDIGWEVIGYATREEYEADKAAGFAASTPSAQSCSLVTR